MVESLVLHFSPQFLLHFWSARGSQHLQTLFFEQITSKGRNFWTFFSKPLEASVRLFEWLSNARSPSSGLFRGDLDAVMPMHDPGRGLPSQADDGDSVGESVNSEATSDSDGSDSGLITDTSDEDASSNHQ
jgi:hypothetical protein